MHSVARATFCFCLLVFTASGLVPDVTSAQSIEKTPKDALTASFSGLTIAIGHREFKEGLFRGLVHDGGGLSLMYFQRSQSGERILDWSSGLSGGVELWNGAIAAGVHAVPLDIGYSFRINGPNRPVAFYFGPYARLDIQWNELLQLDAQHPYWFTQHQVGIRHWLEWACAPEKTLVLRADLALLSLVSRPPVWRDYATYSLNLSDIFAYTNERFHVEALFTALRFETRLEYQVRFADLLPIIYFLDLEYSRCTAPELYQNLEQRAGITLLLSQ